MPISKETLTLEGKKQQPQVFLHSPERVTSPSRNYFQGTSSAHFATSHSHLPSNVQIHQQENMQITLYQVLGSSERGHQGVYHPRAWPEVPSLPAQETVSIHTCNLPETSSPSVLTPPACATPRYAEGWGKPQKPWPPPSSPPAPQKARLHLHCCHPRAGHACALSPPSSPTWPCRSTEIPAQPHSSHHLSQGGRVPATGSSCLGTKAKGSRSCHVRTSYKNKKRGITFGFSTWKRKGKLA